MHMQCANEIAGQLAVYESFRLVGCVWAKIEFTSSAVVGSGRENQQVLGSMTINRWSSGQ